MTLGSIHTVTFTVPDLAPIEHAYTTHLRMRVADRGTVRTRQARRWGAPATAGCPMLTLVPELGEATSLRFIQDPAAGHVLSFTTYGWNAAEITVQDTDTLAAALVNSPFRIIGPPRNLTGFEWIRAMQVLGPAGECLYLTDVSTDTTLATAQSMVGQVFIAVAAGPDIAAMTQFYADRFGNEVSATVAVPIGVVNRANGLDASTRHQLAIVTLPDGTRVELDQYPATTGPRTIVAGHLPPGISMVSFRVSAPGSGQAATCVTGAGGELIELIEV